jgi:aromatic ring hydroxylase
MAIKTGKQYVESLRDGRKLYIDGEAVTDVTSYAPLQGIIKTIASLHDDQHDQKYRDILTFWSPTSGDCQRRSDFASTGRSDIASVLNA